MIKVEVKQTTKRKDLEVWGNSHFLNGDSKIKSMIE